MKLTLNSRKLILTQCAALLCWSVPYAQAGGVGVNLNINVGEPPRPVVVAPPPPAPVYVAPAPPAEVIVVDEDINFIYPSALGFYVAVGVPYDLFYLNNSYYLYRDGRWLRAATPRGPWIAQRHRELPPGLRRHRLERIREYRTREYEVYRRDRDHYRGRHFRSERELWRERHDAKERRKEDHFREKEARKDEKRWEKEEKRRAKEERKEDKRREKEERHHDRDDRR